MSRTLTLIIKCEDCENEIGKTTSSNRIAEDIHELLLGCKWTSFYDEGQPVDYCPACRKSFFDEAKKK